MAIVPNPYEFIIDKNKSVYGENRKVIADIRYQIVCGKSPIAKQAMVTGYNRFWWDGSTTGKLNSISGLIPGIAMLCSEMYYGLDNNNNINLKTYSFAVNYEGDLNSLLINKPCDIILNGKYFHRTWFTPSVDGGQYINAIISDYRVNDIEPLFYVGSVIDGISIIFE